MRSAVRITAKSANYLFIYLIFNNFFIQFSYLNSEKARPHDRTRRGGRARMMPGVFDTSRSRCIRKETSEREMDVQQEDQLEDSSPLNGCQSSWSWRDGEKNINCIHVCASITCSYCITVIYHDWQIEIIQATWSHIKKNYFDTFAFITWIQISGVKSVWFATPETSSRPLWLSAQRGSNTRSLCGQAGQPRIQGGHRQQRLHEH